MRFETYLLAYGQACRLWGIAVPTTSRTSKYRAKLSRQARKFLIRTQIAYVRMDEHHQREIRYLNIELDMEREATFICPRCGSEVSKTDEPVYKD